MKAPNWWRHPRDRFDWDPWHYVLEALEKTNSQPMQGLGVQKNQRHSERNDDRRSR